MNDMAAQRERSDKIFCNYICPVLRGVREKIANDLPSFVINRAATPREDLIYKYDFVNENGLRLAVRVQDNPKYAHYETITLRDTERNYFETRDPVFGHADWYVHAYVQIEQCKTHIFCISVQTMAQILYDMEYDQLTNTQDKKKFIVIDGKLADYRIGWQHDLKRRVATKISVKRRQVMDRTRTT